MPMTQRTTSCLIEFKLTLLTKAVNKNNILVDDIVFRRLLRKEN